MVGLSTILNRYIVEVIWKPIHLQCPDQSELEAMKKQAAAECPLQGSGSLVAQVTAKVNWKRYSSKVHMHPPLAEHQAEIAP